MKKFLLKIAALMFLLAGFADAQVENVPLENPVYDFLKTMKVKGIISSVHEDDPAMSRLEVRRLLETIDGSSDKLSSTEEKLLRKYQTEFYDRLKNSGNTVLLFGGDDDFASGMSGFFSDKNKHLYAYRDSNLTFYLEGLAHYTHGQLFGPKINNSELFDIGFKFRGTVLDKLGYMLMVSKGGVEGSEQFAPTIDPRLKYNFKFIEAIENIGNYDFAEGYLKYYTEPSEKMKIGIELGREKIKMGYGYSGSLVLSGNHPNLDFIKFNFNYGVFGFTSLHASTVGYFNTDRYQNYTKLIAANRFKLSFPDLFEIGFGESIIYTGRGVDIAYFNPFIFYKFVEMSLQDRDNGTVYLDFQTNFIKNLELQATFFMDEDPIARLNDLSRYINKTAYQVGAFWYSPFGIHDLSAILEYTRIRPYVYSHTYNGTDYTAFGQILGNPIGPNSDEIFTRLSYNISEWIKLNFDYAFIRQGKNITDAQGNVLRNVGGDASFPFRQGIDSEEAKFLDGEKVYSNHFTFDLRYEPVRNLFFDFIVKYEGYKNQFRDTFTEMTYGILKMTIEY